MTDMALTTSGGTFSLAPSTFGEACKFAEMVSRSAFCPRDYKGKPGDVLIAMQYGAELGVSPMQAIQGVSVINGRPSVWGDLLLAICRAAPSCEWIHEPDLAEIGETGVAWCEAKRHGEPARKVSFSKDDARKAKLLGKAGPWQQYESRMLLMRARGFCLRDTFADVLHGMISREEALDIPTERPARVVRAPKPRQVQAKPADALPPASEPPANGYSYEPFGALTMARKLGELPEVLERHFTDGVKDHASLVDFKASCPEEYRGGYESLHEAYDAREGAPAPPEAPKTHEDAPQAVEPPQARDGAADAAKEEDVVFPSDNDKVAQPTEEEPPHPAEEAGEAPPKKRKPRKAKAATTEATVAQVLKAAQAKWGDSRDRELDKLTGGARVTALTPTKRGEVLAQIEGGGSSDEEVPF